jgi:hypothetical protein
VHLCGCHIQPERLRAGGVSARESARLLLKSSGASSPGNVPCRSHGPFSSGLRTCPSKIRFNLHITLLYKTLFYFFQIYVTVRAVRPSASATPLIFLAYKRSGPALYAFARRNLIRPLFTKQSEELLIAARIQRSARASTITNVTDRVRSGLPPAPCFWS